MERMPHIDIAALRQAVREDRDLISRHAQERMGLRRITHNDRKLVVATRTSKANRCTSLTPLMATVSVYIGTVHRYDAAKWQDPWTRRRE